MEHLKINPALYTNAQHDLYLGQSPKLSPGPDDCIVHVRCNGICGSDVHFWKTGAIGTHKVCDDHVLGHEGSGDVIWVGEDVNGLQVGDRVAIEPGVPCGRCQECTTGIYNLCAGVNFSGVPPVNGSIRRYHVHNAQFLHKLPTALTYTEGALLEPLSVVLHAFERSPLLIGETTVICGAGPIGLIALAVAKASGAWPLIITDVDNKRLQFAKKFMPTCHTFMVPLQNSAQDVALSILEKVKTLGGEQPRVVYECTGVQSSLTTAAYLPRLRGEVMVVGVGRPILDGLPFMHMALAEIDLKFINRYHHTWPKAIKLLLSGYIDLKPMVTHRFSISDAVAAMKTSADRTSGSVKVHIEDNSDQ